MADRQLVKPFDVAVTQAGIHVVVLVVLAPSWPVRYMRGWPPRYLRAILKDPTSATLAGRLVVVLAVPGLNVASVPTSPTLLERSTTVVPDIDTVAECSGASAEVQAAARPVASEFISA